MQIQSKSSDNYIKLKFCHYIFLIYFMGEYLKFMVNFINDIYHVEGCFGMKIVSFLLPNH